MAMVPVPPSARMFEGCAAVIWHFGDVGPVATDDVLAELHAATHNASTATIGTSAGEYLRGINVLSSTTRAVRLCAYGAPVIWRGIALYVVAYVVALAIPNWRAPHTHFQAAEWFSPPR